jgi:hypothetical protein
MSAFGLGSSLTPVFCHRWSIIEDSAGSLHQSLVCGLLLCLDVTSSKTQGFVDCPAPLYSAFIATPPRPQTQALSCLSTKTPCYRHLRTAILVFQNKKLQESGPIVCGKKEKIYWSVHVRILPVAALCFGVQATLMRCDVM